ncbi:MAG: hypothetical protein IPM84_05060 [Anaerolineae bacterium]|nr:hypothetical protein [Anaerolineae bacterium]
MAAITSAVRPKPGQIALGHVHVNRSLDQVGYCQAQEGGYEHQQQRGRHVRPKRAQKGEQPPGHAAVEGAAFRAFTEAFKRHARSHPWARRAN